MNNFIKNLFSQVDTNSKLSLGIPSRADVQDEMSKQYNDFLELKIKIDNRVEEKLKENSNIEVKYNWVDIDSQIRAGKEILQVLKNEVELLKRHSTDAKEITNIMNSYESALKQAISDYINSGKDYAVNIYIDQMNKYLKENKFKAFDFVHNPITKEKIKVISNYNDIVDICKQIELMKLRLENSEEWQRAHVSRDIVNSKRK